MLITPPFGRERVEQQVLLQNDAEVFYNHTTSTSPLLPIRGSSFCSKHLFESKGPVKNQRTAQALEGV
jgi:hypothetical protein